MNTEFRPPIAQVELALAIPGDMPDPVDWAVVTAQLTRWVVGGDARVERADGTIIDITALAALVPTDLCGATMVIYSPHLALVWDTIVRP